MQFNNNTIAKCTIFMAVYFHFIVSNTKKWKLFENFEIINLKKYPINLINNITNFESEKLF